MYPSLYFTRSDTLAYIYSPWVLSFAINHFFTDSPIMDIPTVAEAHAKAVIVRKNHLSEQEAKEQELLQLLITSSRQAIENTLPVNNSYSIVVKKNIFGPYFNRVMSIFTDQMSTAGWLIVCAEKRHFLTTYLKITFAENPTPTQQSRANRM